MGGRELTEGFGGGMGFLDSACWCGGGVAASCRKVSQGGVIITESADLRSRFRRVQ